MIDVPTKDRRYRCQIGQVGGKFQGWVYARNATVDFIIAQPTIEGVFDYLAEYVDYDPTCLERLRNSEKF